MTVKLLYFASCSKPRLTRTDPLGVTQDGDRWRVVIKWDISWLGEELFISQGSLCFVELISPSFIIC